MNKYLKAYSNEEYKEYISLSNGEISAEDVDLTNAVELVCKKIDLDFEPIQKEEKIN